MAPKPLSLLADDVLDEAEGGQYRLLVEERLLCACLYIRALKQEHLVQAIVDGDAPPIRGATEYGDFEALHAQLIKALGERASIHQKYTMKQKAYTIPCMRDKRAREDAEEDQEDPANSTGPDDAAPYAVPALKGRKRVDLSRHAKL